MITILDVVEHQVDVGSGERGRERCRHRVIETRGEERHQRGDARAVHATNGQPARRTIGAEIQILHRLLHRGARCISHAIAAVEHATNSRDADASTFGNVVNGGRQGHQEALS